MREAQHRSRAIGRFDFDLCIDVIVGSRHPEAFGLFDDVHGAAAVGGGDNRQLRGLPDFEEHSGQRQIDEFRMCPELRCGDLDGDQPAVMDGVELVEGACPVDTRDFRDCFDQGATPLFRVRRTRRAV